MADAVGSIDTPDAQDEAPESKKTRKGGKRAKKGPLKRLALFTGRSSQSSARSSGRRGTS